MVPVVDYTQHGTVQYSTVQYSTVQYSTVQYSTVQYQERLETEIIFRRVNGNFNEFATFSTGCTVLIFGKI